MTKNIFTFIFILSSFMLTSQNNNLNNNINGLSFNLLKTINSENGNVLISAYSISNALALTYMGAKDSTKLEMEKVLFPKAHKSVNKGFYDLNESLGLNKNLQLFSANAIWLENTYNLEKEYVRVISEDFKSEVNKANFSGERGREKARKEINSWVEKKTKEKITDFIKPRLLSESTTLVLVNAIYFFGNWHVKSPKAHSYNGEFKLSQEKVAETEYMTDTIELFYYTDELLNAVEIPYEDGEASMIILLPKDASINLSASLNNQYFNKLLKNLKKEKVDLHIPKFKLESEYELSKYLKDMGLVSLFNSSADFSGITGKKEIHISNVLHKAVIEVNESGTVASAATAIITTRSAVVGKVTKPILFKADHSFIFLIHEKSTGTILFSGNFAKP